MSALIGFLGGVGEAGVKMGQQRLKAMDDEELQRKRIEAEELKEARLIALRAKTEIDSIAPKAEAVADANLRAAPKVAEAEAIIGKAKNKTALEGKIDEATNPQLREATISLETDKAKARATAEAEVTQSLGGNKEYLAAIKNITAAKEGSNERAAAAASAVAAALSQFKLTQEKALADARKDLATANQSGDQAAIAAAKQKIDALAYSPDAEKSERTAAAAVLRERGTHIRGLETRLTATLDPKEQARLKEEIAEATDGYRALQAEFDKRMGINQKADGAGKVSQDDAHAQARAAIAAGASAEAVNKRLKERGYSPLNDDKRDKGAASSKSIIGQPPPAYEPPADSPAGKAKAARESAQREREESSARKREAAAAEYEQVGTDPQAAQRLQDSDLFGYLSTAQRARISQIVNGR